MITVHFTLNNWFQLNVCPCLVLGLGTEVLVLVQVLENLMPGDAFSFKFSVNITLSFPVGSDENLVIIGSSYRFT